MTDSSQSTDDPPRLSKRFEAAKGAPIEVDGQLVQMRYEFEPIEQPTALNIEMEARSSRPQGLRLKARGGHILLNDQVLADVVLWSDTAPPSITASLQPSGGKAMNLRIWNVWRDKVGTTQAWIGDAAILVERRPDGVILRCSDGFAPPSFDELTVKVSLAVPS